VIVAIVPEKMPVTPSHATLQAKIEWKKKLDGSVDIKIRASPSDLRFIYHILKRGRIIPFSSFENTADVPRIVSVLQQNGKLGEKVL
jgi:hypothetical protein